MIKYRIDFTRYAKSLDEIEVDIATRRALKSVTTSVWAKKKFKEFEERHMQGRIIDSRWIEDEEGFNGKEILNNHIKPEYPEARLLSWDIIKL